MKNLNKEEREQARGIVILAVKVIKPDLTDEEAENIIVNVGNYIQLKRLKSSNNQKQYQTFKKGL